MANKSNTDTKKKLTPPSAPPTFPAPTPPSQPVEKPKSLIVTTTTSGEVVSSPIKTARELYMENGNDKKN